MSLGKDCLSSCCIAFRTCNNAFGCHQDSADGTRCSWSVQELRWCDSTGVSPKVISKLQAKHCSGRRHASPLHTSCVKLRVALRLVLREFHKNDCIFLWRSTEEFQDLGLVGRVGEKIIHKQCIRQLLEPLPEYAPLIQHLSNIHIFFISMNQNALKSKLPVSFSTEPKMLGTH